MRSSPKSNGSIDGTEGVGSLSSVIMIALILSGRSLTLSSIASPDSIEKLGPATAPASVANQTAYLRPGRLGSSPSILRNHSLWAACITTTPRAAVAGLPAGGLRAQNSAP